MLTRFSNPKDDEDDEDDNDEVRGLRRWLIAGATGGPMAEDAHCPDWYSYFRAAEVLGCKPWELNTVPMYWIHKALNKAQAENEAQRAIDKSPTKR